MRAPINGYRWRRLSNEQVEAILKARANGATFPQLAAQYGVAQRTVERAVARARNEIRVLEVDGWAATFELTELGPVQVEPWRAA